MIVHLGVVLIAVAFAASHAYEHQAQLTLGWANRLPSTVIPWSCGAWTGQLARAAACWW